MDVQEATITLARLMKSEKDFYETHIKARRPITEEDRKKSEDNLKKFEVLRATSKEFANILAGLPAFYDLMESWVVCVNGKGSVSKDTLIKYKETADLDGLIDLASNLGSTVKSFIRSSGYFITEMGAGEDGWDVNVRCNTKDAKELCLLLHQKFMDAINIGILTVSRRFCEHKLPGLYNYEDAERILQIYGNEEEIL